MNNNAAAGVQLNALAKDLSAASGEPFKMVAKGLVVSAGNQVVQFAQQYAPRRTGALANSIEMTIQGDGLSAAVTANRPYAAYDEFGTGPRGEFGGPPIVITPKRGKYLRFKTKDGRVVYAKRVVSRGMAPRPFMRPAVERIALPLASSLADNAVISIVHGPNHPETLTNAPVT